jgi:hypothetical protein
LQYLFSYFFLLFKNLIPKENVCFISIVFYFLYYFLQEFFLKKTIGKVVTKTEMIINSKNKIYYFLQILIRTIVRCIIIDVFSYLFTNKGFHDLFSKTETVKNKVEYKKPLKKTWCIRKTLRVENIKKI